tara:strand:+ start:3034 stop:3735 length:702 start_codon:yes stop_codon:yes gene_type:complete
MKVTIHQPNYLPYPGLFHKLVLSDVFVILDNVQFQFDVTNRNKIISKDGSWERITVPVKKNQTHKKILDVEINNELSWSENTFEKLCESYDSSNFFSQYRDYFQNLYKKKWDLLYELNLETLKKMIEFLGIKVKILRESELNVNGNSTERLVNICESLNAKTYVSGIGGKNYLNEKLFEEKNIQLEYQNYHYISYSQNNSIDFIPNLSAIDLLFNVGPESLELIKKSRKFDNT